MDEERSPRPADGAESQRDARSRSVALRPSRSRKARDCWPTLLRGDKGFGNEKIMREAELRALAYFFKLRLTANVRRAIERLSRQSEWSTQVKAGRPRRRRFD